MFELSEFPQWIIDIVENAEVRSYPPPLITDGGAMDLGVVKLVVRSVDKKSAYANQAVDGRLWSNPEARVAAIRLARIQLAIFLRDNL